MSIRAAICLRRRRWWVGVSRETRPNSDGPNSELLGAARGEDGLELQARRDTRASAQSVLS